MIFLESQNNFQQNIVHIHYKGGKHDFLVLNHGRRYFNQEIKVKIISGASLSSETPGGIQSKGYHFSKTWILISFFQFPYWIM